MTVRQDPGVEQDTVSSLGEEITLLVDMVAERAGPWLESIVAAGHLGQHDGRHPEGGPRQPEPETAEHRSAESERPIACAWCPLCAVVSVARGERPELSTRALEQAAQLVALLRAVLADRWYPDDGVHMPGFRPETAADEGEPPAEPVAPVRAAREGAPRVQHIAVRKVGVREPADGGER